MNTEEINPKAKLLLNSSCDSDSYLDTIINGYYSMCSDALPMGRFRGTIFNLRHSDQDEVKIVGWQKNVSRLNQTDISLPTIISLSIDRENTIREIDLHPSFKGSKGFLCSRDYLNETIKKKLLNVKIDGVFRRRITVDELHCFHLVEVILGIYSYYNIYKRDINRLLALDTEIFHEEEVTDCLRKERDIYAICRYSAMERGVIDFALRFHDVLDNISFDQDGNIRGLENTKASFYIDNTLIFSSDDRSGEKVNKKRELASFFLRSREEIKRRIYNDSEVTFFNTNLYPPAIMGLVIQSIGIQIFSNNYNYNIHVLTALQRSKNVPKCIGAIKSKEEAERYFPDCKRR